MGLVSWHLHRRVPRAVAVALVTPALIAACSTTPSNPPPVASATVRTAPATQTSISGMVVYTGNAQARTKINVLPKTAGQIVVLNVDTGSVVKKDDVIAELDHAALDAQIAQAQAGIAAAQAKVATIKAGPRPENVAQAQANLQAAQENLKFMQSGGRPENVTSAQGNLETASAHLTSVEQGRSESVAQATANLQAAQAKLQQLKDGPTQQQIQAGELAVEQAKDAAYAANTSKDAACNAAYPASACNAAQAAAAAAATGAQQANAQLKILTSPPTTDQLNQAQAAVAAAQAQVQLAQHPGSSADITAAQGAVQAAQAQLDLAKAPYSSADLAKAQAAVDIANQQLKLAQAPYTQQDLDAANAGVQQAQAALQSANVARDQAIVRAPFDGVVAEKMLSVGAMASPATPIVSLIDRTVDAVVQADAAHVDAFKVGDPATITADALPGKTIAGKITQIAPTVDPQTRTVQIKVTPSTADSGLEDGMLAQVALITGTHQGAVVVPNVAIVQRNGQTVVYVVTNNNLATPMPVSTGLTDGTNTEITKGLQAGQVVVVSGQDSLTTAQPVVVQK